MVTLATYKVDMWQDDIRFRGMFLYFSWMTSRNIFVPSLVDTHLLLLLLPVMLPHVGKWKEAVSVNRHHVYSANVFPSLNKMHITGR